MTESFPSVEKAHLPSAQNGLDFQEYAQIYFWKTPLAPTPSGGRAGNGPKASADSEGARDASDGREGHRSHP